MTPKENADRLRDLDLKAQIDSLAKCILRHWSHEIGDEGAVDVAIRLLERYAAERQRPCACGYAERYRARAETWAESWLAARYSQGGREAEWTRTIVDDFLREVGVCEPGAVMAPETT